MKKNIYYVLLFASWFCILLIFSLIFALLGITNLNFGWGYAIGSGCGYPFLWLISAGLTMLFRPFFNNWVFKEKHNYPKKKSFIIIIIGVVWMIFTVTSLTLRRQAEQKLIEEFQQSQTNNW